MIVRINGQELMVPQVDGSKVPTYVPWWDISGQVDLAMENLRESAAEFFTDIILGFLEALAIVIVDLSYAAALLGGGILIIARAVTGIRKIDQWFALLLLIHFLIQFLLG